MIYYASKPGAHPDLIQKLNLEFAAQELATCESRGEVFVYIVPACMMFDFSVPGRIVESTPPTPQEYCGAIIAVAEDMVRRSDMGYVLRVMPFVETVSDTFKSICRGAYSRKRIHDVMFQFSSRRAVEDIAGTMVADRQYAESVGHIRHVFSRSRFSTSYVFFRLLAEEAADTEFDSDGLSIFPDRAASFCSEHADALTPYFGQFNFQCGLEELDMLGE